MKGTGVECPTREILETSAVADLMSLALEFARAFNKAVRSFRMYSPTHPQVQLDLKDAFGWLEKMIGEEPSVALGTREGTMIIQGRPVREMTPTLKSFIDSLTSRGLTSFSVHRGATLAEFSAMVDILVKKPEDVMQGDGIKPELLAPLHNIRVNELRFVALEEGVSEQAVTALAAGGEQQQELLQIVSAFLNGDVGPGGDGSGAGGGGGSGGGGGGGGGGRGGAAGRVVSERLSALVKSGNVDEFVGMIDTLAGQLEAAGIAPEERTRRMNQLLKLLPVAEEVQKLRRIVMMQEDESLVSEWGTALTKAGFEVVPVSTPAAMMEKLADKSYWSGLVADAGFRGPEGVKFLADIAATGRRPVPVVLLSWDESLKDAKPVAKYPVLRFLVQPAEPPIIAAALDEIALPPRIARPTAAELESNPKLAHELKRAREIQMRLLPSVLPQPPGFEIAARYLPAENVSGDYYDVIPLPNGRVGLLVADVAGKGVSAAMIMVMARTVFHAVAPECFTPRNTVLRAGERISEDLPLGVFLTLVYAVLDPESGLVSIVNCGHTESLLWTKFDGMSIVQTVEASGAAMGLVRGATFERSLKTCDVTLAPGEQLILYTDGVNEAMSESQEEFGDKRLFKAIKAGGPTPAERMVERIVEAVLAHRGAAPASDDLTLLVVRREGTA